MLQHLTEQGVGGRLELVLVDRGITAAAARKLGRDYDLELRRVGWDEKQPVFRPIRHAWRVEVAHGRLGRARRLAKSFENTTTSRPAGSRSPASLPPCGTCRVRVLAAVPSLLPDDSAPGCEACGLWGDLECSREGRWHNRSAWKSPR